MASPPRRGPGPRGRLRNRVQFLLERFVLRGLGHRLLFAAAIILAVSLTGGALVFALDPEIVGPGEGVWWAFLRLTDPGYLGDDEGAARRALSTVLTVLGFLVFLGLLIAILTQWLNQAIARLESGVTPVAFRDHLIVLGWTHRTPTIVQELLRTRNRVARFLERHGARELRIVVLAERVDARLVHDLRTRLGDLWSDRQVLLRSGSPLRLEHLDRVAFRDAAALILPGADHGEDNPEGVDAETMKTLMAISRHAIAGGTTPPLAVAEMYDGRRTRMGQQAYAGECEIVAADEIIARLIAQSLGQRGVCEVFAEILTVDAGNAIYLKRASSAAGRFGDLIGSFPKAIPLGLFRSEARTPVLVPDPSTDVVEGDHLVFLARRYDDCGVRVETPLVAEPAATRPRGDALEPGRRLLVMGWSRKVPALLRELAAYGPGAFSIDVVSSTPIAERQALLDRYGSGLEGASVTQIEANYSLPGILEDLASHAYDNVVLMASERLSDEERSDANTAVAYLMLRGVLTEVPDRPDILVELLDADNVFLFDTPEVDVIVSPLVVSYLLSQVALRRELRAIFYELSRPRGAQIVLRRAAEYGLADGPVAFGELERAVAARGDLALGVRIAGGVPSLNPDRDERWSLTEVDEVVALTWMGERDDA